MFPCLRRTVVLPRQGFQYAPQSRDCQRTSTTYGVFVLGQSLDVDIVEKREIRQIRKCPDEIRRVRLYRLGCFGGIAYHFGYSGAHRASGAPAGLGPTSPSRPFLAFLPYLPPKHPHVQGRWEAGLFDRLPWCTGRKYGRLGAPQQNARGTRLPYVGAMAMPVVSPRNIA